MTLDCRAEQTVVHAKYVRKENYLGGLSWAVGRPSKVPLAKVWIHVL